VKVEELIERLKKFDGNLPVILASDEEGNQYHRLEALEMDAYSEHEGEIELVHPSDIEGDEPLAVTLWPKAVQSFATAGAGGRGRFHVTRLSNGFMLSIDEVPADFDGDEPWDSAEVFISEQAGAALADWLRGNA
jgi:hypothetical protein